jgi:putative transcription factor
LRCEVCGHKIRGKPNRVIIEKAKLEVCSECSKLGTGFWEQPKPKSMASAIRAPPAPLRIQPKKTPQPPMGTSLELVEDFNVKIRQAREKLGLSHEELGKRINEKVSLLRKIETGKMTPDNRLATTLEHALKIKLIAPAKEEKVPQTKMATAVKRELTLGDLVQLEKKDRKKEDSVGRKLS